MGEFDAENNFTKIIYNKVGFKGSRNNFDVSDDLEQLSNMKDEVKSPYSKMEVEILELKFPAKLAKCSTYCILIR